MSKWLEANPNLIQTINDKLPDSFLSQYDLDSVTLLLDYLYGKRKVAFNVSDRSVDDVATLLVLVYGNKWKNELALIEGGWESGIEVEKKIQENSSNMDTLTRTANAVESTSAYNDDTLVESESNADTQSDEHLKESEHTRTETTKSFDALLQQRRVLDESFARTLCDDIAQTLTISIY